MGGKTSNRKLNREGVAPSTLFRQGDKDESFWKEMQESLFRKFYGGEDKKNLPKPSKPKSSKPKPPRRVYKTLSDYESAAAMAGLKNAQAQQVAIAPDKSKFSIESKDKKGEMSLPKDFFEHIPEIEQPILDKMPKKAGMVVIEPDGRVWMVRPRNEYGGYVQTFPKGGSEGQDLVYTAMKETAEETGLAAVPVAYLDDVMGDYNPCRFYIGVRVDGDPNKPGTPFETETVTLEELGTAHENAIRSDGSPSERDQEIIMKAIQWMRKNGLPTLDHIKKMRKFSGLEEQKDSELDKGPGSKTKKDEWGEL